MASAGTPHLGLALDFQFQHFTHASGMRLEHFIHNQGTLDASDSDRYSAHIYHRTLVHLDVALISRALAQE